MAGQELSIDGPYDFKSFHSEPLDGIHIFSFTYLSGILEKLYGEIRELNSEVIPAEKPKRISGEIPETIIQTRKKGTGTITGGTCKNIPGEITGGIAGEIPMGILERKKLSMNQ